MKTRAIISPSFRISSLAVLAVVALSSGCGDSGPTRWDIQGKVTFAGQPIPTGVVLFEPDVSQGNQGPAGSATITNGSYDTRRNGRGTVGGPHLVRIVGFDGVATSDEAPGGAPLFPEYSVAVDLPDTETDMDFDVPAEAKRGSAPRPAARAD